MSDFRIPIPRIGFKPPIYYCKKTDKSLVLDGRLDKKFWEDIPFTDEFADIEGKDMAAPLFSTRVKMAWDEENLYVGALLEGEEVWAYVTEHDDVIFQDNDFEIFIDPDSDTQQYYEFEINAGNTTWDLFLPFAYRDGGSALNGYEIRGLQSAVYIDGGRLNEAGSGCRSWSVEVVIPFAALTECIPGRSRPVPGDFYRMNFSRVHWQVEDRDGLYIKKRNPDTGSPFPEANWVWAPTGVINIHYPELWGFVFFVDAGMQQPSIPDDEYRKWELRKLYYAQNIYFDMHGFYSSSLEELRSILDSCAIAKECKLLESLDYQVETTSHSFELSVSSADGLGKILLMSCGKAFYQKCSKEERN